MTIGDIRENAGYTIEETADMLGLSVFGLRQLEEVDHTVKKARSVLKTYCNKAGVDPNVFYEEDAGVGKISFNMGMVPISLIRRFKFVAKVKGWTYSETMDYLLGLSDVRMPLSLDDVISKTGMTAGDIAHKLKMQEVLIRGIKDEVFADFVRNRCDEIGIDSDLILGE